jgi:DNA-binding transcriptional regulator YhcF (GntR family)
MDDQDRDAELSAALEKFLRDTMASGYTKEQAVEMIRQEICDAEVRHRRSQIKPVP